MEILIFFEVKILMPSLCLHLKSFLHISLSKHKSRKNDLKKLKIISEPPLSWSVCT